MSRSKGEILRIRISEELKNEVFKLAEETGETISVITRQALREHIERHRSKVMNFRQSELDLAERKIRVAESTDDDEHAPGD